MSEGNLASDLSNFGQNIDLSDGRPSSIHGFEVSIYQSERSKLGIECSSLIRVNTLIGQTWQPSGYHGNMITCNNDFLAYVLKGSNMRDQVIRLIQRKTKDRALLKKFTGCICDLAFLHTNSNILGVVDQSGGLYLYYLDRAHGDVAKMSETLRVKLFGSLHSDQLHHKLSWCPLVHEEDTDNIIIAVSHGNRAEVYDVSDLVSEYGSIGLADKTKLDTGHVFIDNAHEGDIYDLSLSPDGNVLATAGQDGHVKFWQIDFEDNTKPMCLHDYQPHGGKPVTRLLFCDDHVSKDPGKQFWRFLLTSAEDNTVIKIWCTVKWKCLQTIKFLPPNNGSYLNSKMVINFDQTASYLLVADTTSMVLYILALYQEPSVGDATFTSITEYPLTQQILSFVISRCSPVSHDHTDSSDEDEDDNEGAGLVPFNPRRTAVVLQMHCIQTKSLQMLNVRFEPPGLMGIPPPVPIDMTDNDLINTSINSGSILTPSTKMDSNPYAPGQSSPSVILLSPGSFIGSTPSKTTAHALRSPSDFESLPIAICSQQSDLEGGKSLNDSGSSSLNIGQIVTLPLKSYPSHDEHNEEMVVATSPNSLPSNVNELFPSAHDNNDNSAQNVATNSAHDITTSSTHVIDALNVTNDSAHDVITIDSTNDVITIDSASNDDLAHNNNDSDSAQNTNNVNTSIPDLLTTPTNNEDDDWPNLSSEEFNKKTTDPNKTGGPSDDSDTDITRYIMNTKGHLLSSDEKKPDFNETGGPPNDSDTDITRYMVDTKGHPLSHDDKIPDPNNMGKRLDDSDTQYHIPHKGLPLSHDELNDDTDDIAREAASAVVTMAITAAINSIEEDRVTDNSKEEDIVKSKSDSAPQLDTVNPIKSEVDEEAHTVPHSLSSKAESETLKLLLDIVRQQQLEIHELRASTQQAINGAHEVMEKSQQAINGVQVAMERSLAVFSHKQQTYLQDQYSHLETLIKDRPNIDPKKLTQSLTSTVNTAVNNQVDKCVKNEFKRTVSPALQRQMTATQDQCVQIVHQKLDVLVRETIERSINVEDIIANVSKKIVASLHQLIQTNTDAIFHNSVLPSFQQSLKEIFTQINEMFRSGLAEYLSQLQIGQNAVHENTLHSLHSSLTGPNSPLVQTINSTLSQELNTLSHQLDQSLSSNITSVVKASIEEGLSSIGPMNTTQSFQQQKERIRVLIEEKQYDAAFNVALSTSNLELVTETCQMVAPDEVFDSNAECTLTQPVLLSLIQQLAVGLQDNIELKIKYLEMAILSLDPSDQVTSPHLPPVMQLLHEQIVKLEEQLHQTGSGSPGLFRAAKRVRMLSDHVRKSSLK